MAELAWAAPEAELALVAAVAEMALVVVVAELALITGLLWWLSWPWLMRWPR